MSERSFIWCFALGAVVVWRAVHLLACENGPFDLIARLRTALGSGILGRLMDSYFCLSFLLSLPLALWISCSRIGFLIEWLTLSVVACLLERMTQRLQKHVRVTPVSTSYIEKIIRGA